MEPSLHQRLDVIRIDVPALRSRREDVGLLATRFMRDISREYGRPERKFAPESLRALRQHTWPGNIRELRNVVERLLLLAPEEIIRVKDLPGEMGGARTPAEDLYREQRYVEAIAVLKDYLLLYPDDPGAHFYLGERGLGATAVDCQEGGCYDEASPARACGHINTSCERDTLQVLGDFPCPAPLDTRPNLSVRR